MKVLLVDQFGELGGAQRGMIEAAMGIVNRGGEVWAAMPEGPAFDELSTIATEMVAIPCGPFHAQRKRGADHFRYLQQLPAQVSAIARLERSVDLVYVHGPRVAPAAALAKRARPLVYHAHSIVQQRSAASLLALALRKCDAIIALSRFVLRWVQTLGAGPEPQLIYNGVSGFPWVPKARDEFTRIGILGRVAPEKGQLAFVRAARIASQIHPHLRFAVAGGPMFTSQDYYDAVRAEAGPEVHFEPWSEDTSSFFQRIDILVVPSSPVDAGPRVVLEGFAAGVPVLGSNSGGNPELIEHGLTGLLLDSLEPAELAQAMVHAARQPDLLRAIALRGRARWQEFHTVARFQSDVCGALEGVLRKSAGKNARAW
jgi:glycosyltransferase involved in cell wall biosynthesis